MGAKQGVASMLGGKKEQKRAKQKALLLEKKAQKDSVEELVNKVKKAERASKEGQDVDEHVGSSPAAPSSAKQASVEAPGQDAQHCAVCGDVFPSRSKLFKHIEATGHAALKSGAAPEPATSKGKNKKR